jgi:flagellar motor switch protein FliM
MRKTGVIIVSDEALLEATASLLEAERSLERALSAGQNRPERLPGLQMIFGQLPRIMAEEVGSLSVMPLRVRLVELSAATIGDTCALPLGALAGVARAERWRSWVYFITEPSATSLFVVAATGCEDIPEVGLPKRKPTGTDANLLRVLFRRVSRALTNAFSILTDIEFDVGDVVEKIELEPNLSQSTPVIAARLGIEYGGHEGMLTIVIPQAGLENIRDLLAAATPQEAVGSAHGADSRGDPAWSRQLAEEIARAFIDLNGILEERPIPLGEISRLKVGSVIELHMSSISRVRLDAGDKPLFWCELGKRENGLVLRVDHEFDQQREMVDEFFGL